MLKQQEWVHATQPYKNKIQSYMYIVRIYKLSNITIEKGCKSFLLLVLTKNFENTGDGSHKKFIALFIL